MTFRYKLILWYTAVLAGLLILFGGTVYGVTRLVLTASIDRSLNATADEVWRNSSAALVGQFGSRDDIRIQMPEIDVFRASGVVVQVWDMSDGQRLARTSSNLASYTAPLDADALAASAALDLTAHTETPLTFTDTTINGVHWRVLTRPVDVLDRRVIIQAAASMDATDQAGRDVLIVMIALSLIALVLSILVGYFMSNRAMQPVRALIHATEQVITADDLSTRIPWEGPIDELGKLTGVFNTMMERLQHLFGVQQRLVADVSHELRTPLTAIRGHLDLIRRYGVDEESLAAMHIEVERMTRMVNDLLLLAKADYGGLSLNLEPLELEDVLTRVYSEVKTMAAGRPLTVSIGQFEPVRVRGDADRLHQLLLNLAGNALKFTPDGGSITFELRRDTHHAVVTVRDTGIGISENDQKHIFDRFYQVEQSRAREQGNEGTGLGLSIAKWVTEVHGGSIAVSSRVGEGTLFTVRLPHLEAPAPPETVAVTRPRLSILPRPRDDDRE